MRMHIGKVGIFAMVAAVLWGINYPLVKLCLQYIPENQFLFLRFSLAAAFMLLGLLSTKEGLAVRRKHLGRILWLGFLCFGIYNLIWTAGIHRTSPANMALLISCAPIFTSLLAVITRAEKLPFQHWLGLGLAFCGMVTIIVLTPKANINLGAEYWLGNLLGLLAAILFSFYNTLARPLLDEYSPLKLNVWVMGSSLVVFIPVGVWGGGWVNAAQIPPQIWLAFLYVVLFGTLVAYMFWYKGIQEIGPVRTVLYHYLVSVISMFGSSLFLGEMVSLPQVSGAIMVLFGLLCQNFRREKIRSDGELNLHQT